MSFFSSKRSFALLLAAGAVLTACGPRPHSSDKRTPLPPLDPSEFMPKKNIGLAAEDELLNEFFQEPADSPTSDIGPCAWIEAYPRPNEALPRFRMAQDLVLSMNDGKIQVDPDQSPLVGANPGSSTYNITPNHHFDSFGLVNKPEDQKLMLDAYRNDNVMTVFKSLQANMSEQEIAKTAKHAFPIRMLNGKSPQQLRLKEIKDTTNSNDTDAPKAEFSLNGRIDIAANPVYQLGLTRVLSDAAGSGQIPVDRDAYLKQLDEAINLANFFVKTPLNFLQRLILSSNIIDFFKIRNDKIGVQISDSLPGTFDADNPTTRSIYNLPTNIVPRIVFDNAMKDEIVVLPTGGDSQQQLNTKLFKLRRMLSAYQKDLPLFVNNSWQTYEQDSRVSINLALKGMLSDDADEQVCGSVLFNRSLSQMLTFMGFVRPPMVSDPVVQSSHLPPVAQMLDNPEGHFMRSCPIPGILAVNGVRKLMSADDLGDTSDNAPAYGMSTTIPDMPNCDTSLAAAEGSWDYAHFRRFYSPDTANSDDWVALLRSVSQFMTAFNPGAPWWMGDRGLPMMNASDLKTAVKSGGVVPFEAHGLALGLLAQGGTQILNRYLVMLDGYNKETTSSDDAMAIRISFEPHKPGSGGQVKTTLYSATLLAEAAFKFGVAFKKLADWTDSAEKARASLAYIRDYDTRTKAIDEYNSVIRGMFGSMDTLKKITENSDTSLRHQVQSLGLASAVLLSRFVRPMPDGTYDCYSEVHDNLDNQEETQTGVCTDKERSRYKRVLKIIAQAYGSPLFARYAE